MNRRRVDTVLRIRELQERLAKQQVVSARLVLAERERAEHDARALVADRARSGRGATTGAQLVDRRHMLSSGVEHSVRLAGQVLGASHTVDGTMVSWRVEAERLDGIERLSERIAEQEREETVRREAALIDDLVIARWPARAAQQHGSQQHRSQQHGSQQHGNQQQRAAP